MRYDYTTLSFAAIAKELLNPGITIKNIIVDQEKQTIKLWMAIPEKKASDAKKD